MICETVVNRVHVCKKKKRKKRKGDCFERTVENSFKEQWSIWARWAGVGGSFTKNTMFSLLQFTHIHTHTHTHTEEQCAIFTLSNVKQIFSCHRMLLRPTKMLHRILSLLLLNVTLSVKTAQISVQGVLPFL